MGKTATIKKKTTKNAKVSTHSQGSLAMNTTIRFSEKREGRVVGIVKGRRFGTILKSEPLKLDEWASVMYVSTRTLQTRIKENTSFEPLQSERVELVMQVMERGKEVFGDTKKFRRWLDAPRPMLSGKKPIDLLNDLSGIGEVFAELGRIEHGVF
jgi:putative toxin-antitoxin system antitoxin component (TIGR02293 family)